MRRNKMALSMDINFLHRAVLTATLLLSLAGENASYQSRDSSYLKYIVRNQYPMYYTPEPFTYPGPAPAAAVHYGTRAPNPYPMHNPNPPTPTQDIAVPPKWCDKMWKRNECGKSCWMLRKICWNIVVTGGISNDTTSDAEGSSSTYSPYYRPPFHPKKAVAYGKTGVANTYYAQPLWYYPKSYYNRYPYNYYKPAPSKTEFGLNPQFSYLDDYDEARKVTTTTPAPVKREENSTANADNSTIKMNEPETTTENNNKVKVVKVNTPVGVKVKVSYPQESEIATLSPLMFDYDQQSMKKYYGDRFYLSTMLPVSDRKFNDDDDYTDFEDLDDPFMAS